MERIVSLLVSLIDWVAFAWLLLVVFRLVCGSAFNTFLHVGE